MSETPRVPGRILVVDDDQAARELLVRRLRREGHTAVPAACGEEALELLGREEYDLVALDFYMPGLDGLGTLQRIRAHPVCGRLPVLMISAEDAPEGVVSALELGADDYIAKPFNTVLLKARVHALLERKRLRDREVQQREEIERQRAISERLLLNILPGKVAAELAERGAVEPVYHADATIGFTDFVGFTLSSEEMAASELVALLNEYFTVFDTISQNYGLEKLKTIGDSYMFAAGLPEPSLSHAVDAVLAAHEMVRYAKARRDAAVPAGWQIRVGVHTGPVVAGVAGKTKFAYDVWGDTVNLASRMESGGAADRVNVSSTTYSRVKDFFACERRGSIRTKDGRSVDMFFADAIRGTAADFRQRYQHYFGRPAPGEERCKHA